MPRIETVLNTGTYMNELGQGQWSLAVDVVHLDIAAVLLPERDSISDLVMRLIHGPRPRSRQS
jgi:hypothetical protein